MPAPPLAIVLDLDGTLLDSLPDIQAALSHSLESHGRRAVSLQETRGMLGDGAELLVRRALALTAAGAGAPAPTEERFLEHFLDRYGRHSAVTTCPFEGVEETIGLLARRGHRLGICSNKPHRATVELLQRLGWRGRFDAVLGGDAVPNRKPDPEHLRATLRAMDAAGRPAVMVGDTMPDAQVAQRAGVPFVLAAYGYARVPLEQIPADATIQRFEQLPGVLEELMARSR